MTRQLVFTILLTTFLQFSNSHDVFAAHFAKHGLEPAVVSTIINGKNSPPRSFYVQIKILKRSGEHHFCGGVIYEDDWVITAASCIYPYKARELRVVVGDLRFGKKVEYYDVHEVHIHDSFSISRRVSRHNVALLYLSSPMKDFHANRLRLCEEFELDDHQLASCGLGLISTTELNYPNYLQEAFFYETNFKSMTPLPQFCGIDEVCVESPITGANICYFDEGSPLYKLNCRGEPVCVYGIASHALHDPKNPAKMCTAGSVFSRISYYIGWITSTVAAEELFSMCC